MSSSSILKSPSSRANRGGRKLPRAGREESSLETSEKVIREGLKRRPYLRKSDIRGETSQAREDASSQGREGTKKVQGGSKGSFQEREIKRESSRERTQVSELRRESSKERELKREN